MYSPAAMAKAPARRPATPASTTTWGSGLAPATPMMRLALETSPSLAPKTAASIEVDGGALLVEALPDGVGVESPHAGSSEQVRAAPSTLGARPRGAVSAPVPSSGPVPSGRGARGARR